MRDIRGDLEERVFLIEAQIAATSTDFENAVEQLKNKLRADIASLGVALLAEQYQKLPRGHDSRRRPAIGRSAFHTAIKGVGPAGALNDSRALKRV